MRIAGINITDPWPADPGALDMSNNTRSINNAASATLLAAAVSLASSQIGRADEVSGTGISTTETAQTADDPCAAEQAALKTTFAKVQEDYKAKISAKTQEFAERSKGLKKDSDDAKPSTAGAMLGIDLDIGWKDQTIIFDTPSLVMKDNKMILGLPEIVMHEQHWIYDLPAVKMVLKQTGEYPELTCGDGFLGLGCTLKFSPILTNVPEFYMERHDTILGVPEFAIRDQTIIMGLPEFFMQRQKIILGLPQFTVKDVHVEIGNVKREAAEFAQQANTETAALSTAMQADLRKAGSEKLHQIFQCHRAQVAANKDREVLKLDAQIATTTAAAKAARDAHAAEQANAADAVVVQLTAAKAAIAAQFDGATKQVDTAEEKAIGSLAVRQADNGTPQNNAS